MKLDDIAEREIKHLLRLGYEPGQIKENQEFVELIYRYRDLIKNHIFPFIANNYKEKTTDKKYKTFSDEAIEFLKSKQQLENLDKAISFGAVRKVWADLELKEDENKLNGYLRTIRKKDKIKKLYSYVFVFECIHQGNFEEPIRRSTPKQKGWNLYFHRVFFEGLRNKEHSGIGSARMLYDAKNNEYIILNDVKNGGYNYRGVGVKTDDSVISFTLDRVVPGEKKDDRYRLFIKAFMNVEKSEDICLGAYLSYEKSEKIRVGTLVFERIEDPNSCEIIPNLLCPIHYRKHYVDVPEQIRMFLSRKDLNRIQLKKGIQTFTDLNSFVESSSSNRCFTVPQFPVEYYQIFISTPVTGSESFQVKSKVIESIINNEVFETYNEYLKFVSPVLRGNNKVNYIDYQDNFHSIKSSSLFVYIHDKSVKASFSLIELGYALSFCQRVIIFYEKESDPKQIEHFDNLDSVTVKKIDDIQSYEHYSFFIKSEIDAIIPSIELN